MMKLYGYWRSSASYRVRIALAIKGISYKQEAINLKTGAHKERSHLARNPQGVLPVLELEDGTYLNQSLAIIDYLETRYPGNSLYPQDPIVKSKVLAAALIIAADISPIQNLSVLNHISEIYKADTHARAVWAAHWIEHGFEAIEKLLSENKQDFYLSNKPTLFEACLVPQVYNARRFSVDLQKFPRIAKLDEACRALAPFKLAAPENQTDMVLSPQ